MKQDLLLTPKERDTLWERYEKEYPLQDIDWDDIICQAQLAKADPQGAYNRGFEQGKFEERQRILTEFDCLKLAPNDDAYFRILVNHTLKDMRTGKHRAERQKEEKWNGILRQEIPSK